MGLLGEGALIWDGYDLGRPLLEAPKRVLSRHPSKHMVVGLNSWHANLLAQSRTFRVNLCSEQPR